MSPTFDERDEREEREREVRVLISDKRHSRDIEEGAEEEEAPTSETAAAEPVAESAAEAVAAESGSAAVLDFPAAADSPARPLNPIPQPAPSEGTFALHDDGADWGAGQPAAGPGLGGEPPAMSEEEQAAAAIEMAQLQQVFAGGLSRYLQAQLGLLLNFALIGLGRAPDPTSGLVTQNLGQARLAIDVLEFLVLRLESELHPQDRQQLGQLVADLKYAFMQLVQAPAPGGVVPPGGVTPAGGSA